MKKLNLNKNFISRFGKNKFIFWVTLEVLSLPVLTSPEGTPSEPRAVCLPLRGTCDVLCLTFDLPLVDNTNSG